MADLRTYENMDLLAGSMDFIMRRVLVNYWRQRLWETATHEHRTRARAAVPELWRTVFDVTLPDINTLARWERDHGYVSR